MTEFIHYWKTISIFLLKVDVNLGFRVSMHNINTVLRCGSYGIYSFSELCDLYLILEAVKLVLFVINLVSIRCFGHP